MPMRMTKQDWGAVLDVFRAARSRRGDKGRSDRRFLEALHYFTVHDITWRALPAQFGNWNGVWQLCGIRPRGLAGCLSESAREKGIR